MLKSIIFILCFLFTVHAPVDVRQQIAAEMENSIRTELLNKWYPQSMDTVYGGFTSSYSFDFKKSGSQDKMIVTQARHTWSNAKASLRYPQLAYYKEGAKHGFLFLKNNFWDKTYGGFYTLLAQNGAVKDSLKTAYGNAFGIYALAAYYGASKDTAALSLAKQAFYWLEKYSHDPVYKGYYQHLQRNGTVRKRSATTSSNSDLGYKDQNSSIHLMEALTELYKVWPDKLVKTRLQEMLLLVRDVITTPRGNLTLYLQPDWKPISFQDSSRAYILSHRLLDHVSFGHDVETAFLMLEAAEAIGLKKDKKTLVKAKLMVDHALENGWDKELGGFYDEGYYFKGDNKITILLDSKNWWAQAEGLNTLLLMADYFPADKHEYFNRFQQLWQYTQTYLIDHVNGDWYEEGLDKEPQRKTALKGHIWKATYHHYRALYHCVNRLLKSKNDF